MKNYIHILYVLYIFPDDLDGKEYACNMGDPGLIPGWKRSPGEGNDNPLHYSCLENLRGRGACSAALYGVTQSWARLKRLSSSVQKSKNICSGHLKGRVTPPPLVNLE